MHKTIIRNIILSTLLLTTGLVIADTSPVSQSAAPTKINGFYIGGGFSQSFINDDGYDIDYDGSGASLGLFALLLIGKLYRRMPPTNTTAINPA